MMIMKTIRPIVSICALLLVAGFTLAAQAQEKRPNVVVILVDDLAYGDIGAFGCPDIPTPHIDRIAERGVRCLNGYVVSPICSPSRAGLLTGMYPQRFQMNGNANRGQPMPKDHPTIAQAMKDAGYVTGMIGRWDAGDRTQGALDAGFMEVAKRPSPKVGGHRPTYLGEDGSYWTSIQGLEMVGFVQRHQTKPFFLYFAPLAVHSPVEDAPVEYLKRVPKDVPRKRRALAATLIAVDDAIGQLTAELDRLKLTDNTLIFFLGDNGGRGRDRARNLPWRGAKASFWEGGVHVPFIVSWPKRLPQGVDYTAMVSSLDIYPSSVAAAGSTLSKRLDGVDLIPYLDGQKKGVPHEYLYWRWIEPERTDIKTDKKRDPKEMRAIRHGPWRLVGYRDNQDFSKYLTELYNLKDDPGEKNNVINQHPKIAKQLEEKLKEWEDTLPPVIPNANGNSSMQGPMPSGRGWEKRK